MLVPRFSRQSSHARRSPSESVRDSCYRAHPGVSRVEMEEEVKACSRGCHARRRFLRNPAPVYKAGEAAARNPRKDGVLCYPPLTQPVANLRKTYLYNTRQKYRGRGHVVSMQSEYIHRRPPIACPERVGKSDVVNDGDYLMGRER